MTIIREIYDDGGRFAVRYDASIGFLQETPVVSNAECRRVVISRDDFLRLAQLSKDGERIMFRTTAESMLSNRGPVQRFTNY